MLKPITLLPEEISTEINGKKNLQALSESSKRQIDAINDEWHKAKCSKIK